MYYVGFDIGGSSIKAGLVDELGSVVEVHRAATIVNDLDALLSTLVDLFGEFREKPVRGVGVGVPGLRSYETGVIETSPNIPCLRSVQLEALLGARLGVP